MLVNWDDLDFWSQLWISNEQMTAQVNAKDRDNSWTFCVCFDNDIECGGTVLDFKEKNRNGLVFIMML